MTKTQSYQGFCPYDWAFLFSQGHIGVHDFRQELRYASRFALCPAGSEYCPLHMIYFTYGLAILANTDHLYLTETELREAFRREFRALISIYGKPAKLPEFAVKAGVVL